MPGLQKQILELFSDVDPDLREVVADVLMIELELIHMGKPRGVMEKINDILEHVARISVQEGGHEA